MTGPPCFTVKKALRPRQGDKAQSHTATVQQELHSDPTPSHRIFPVAISSSLGEGKDIGPGEECLLPER